MAMPIHIHIHINTLEYARKLAAAGISPQQADAQAQALYDVLAQSIVVVPDGLTLLRTDILTRIDVVKVEINAVEQRLAALENYVRAKFKTLNWMITASLAMHAMVLYKLFAPHS